MRLFSSSIPQILSIERTFLCVLFIHFPLNYCSFLQCLELPGTGFPLCPTQQVYQFSLKHLTATVDISLSSHILFLFKTPCNIKHLPFILFSQTQQQKVTNQCFFPNIQRTTPHTRNPFLILTS